MPHDGLLPPRYDDAGLAGVLPAVAASLGVTRYAAPAHLPLPERFPGGRGPGWGVATQLYSVRSHRS